MSIYKCQNNKMIMSVLYKLHILLKQIEIVIVFSGVWWSLYQTVYLSLY